MKLKPTWQKIKVDLGDTPYDFVGIFAGAIVACQQLELYAPQKDGTHVYGDDTCFSQSVLEF